jgi:DnaK suppressor protein
VNSNDRIKYLQEVKATLLKRKAELEEILITLSKEKFSDDQVQDLGDQALNSTMEAVRGSYQNTEHEEYNMILKALKAIDDGTYGVCIDCGLPISEKRLKYYPNASRCLACQELAESPSV